MQNRFHRSSFSKCVPPANPSRGEDKRRQVCIKLWIPSLSLLYVVITIRWILTYLYSVSSSICWFSSFIVLFFKNPYKTGSVFVYSTVGLRAEKRSTPKRLLPPSFLPCTVYNFGTCYFFIFVFLLFFRFHIGTTFFATQFRWYNLF